MRNKKFFQKIHYTISGHIFKWVAFLNKIRHNTPNYCDTLDIEDLRHLNADEPIAKFYTGKPNERL